MLDSVSLRSLHAALDGLSARERAVGDDIANVNTPYFTARRVSFESQLRSAVEDGTDPMAVRPVVTYSADPAGLTGNNVSLEAETLLGLDTSLRYDLAVRATSDRFSLLRTALRTV
ncbi:MAG: flagellar biosynthesis protein FlgB [Actinomycetales bacterium]|nr:flagellar biosynthesis protein FlgB [Actinomycetales bacterium]